MDDLTKRLAKSLYDVLYELHPVHPNTAFHSPNGIGGQAMTQCCHILDRNATNSELNLSDEAHNNLRDALRLAEQEGVYLLA